MSALATIVFATTLIHPPPKAITLDASAAVKAACASPKSPACDAAVWDLERSMIADLALLSRAKESPAPAVLRSMLKLENGAVREASIRSLARNPDPADVPVVEEALRDPAIGVRRSAARMTAQYANDRLTKIVKLREYEELFGDRREPNMPVFEPDRLPAEKDLGAAIYPGAIYEYFTSGAKAAVFTSTDSQDKVVAFYAKGGKTALTADAMHKRFEAAKKPDPNAMMAAMMAAQQRGEDPKKIIENLQAASMGAGEEGKFKVLEGKEGVSNALYIPLTETAFGGTKIPTTVVVVFKDEVFGRTGICFPRAMTSADLAKMTGPGAELHSRGQTILTTKHDIPLPEALREQKSGRDDD